MAILSNPVGALANQPAGGDFTDYVDRDGFDAPYYAETFWMQADGAITKGSLVELVPATSTAPLRVATAGTTAEPFAIVGVARTPATAAGQMVEVVKYGFVMALAENGVTPAALDPIVNGGTTAGRFGVDPTQDDTDVAGKYLGVVLAPKVDGDLCPIWFGHRA